MGNDFVAASVTKGGAVPYTLYRLVSATAGGLGKEEGKSREK